MKTLRLSIKNPSIRANLNMSVLLFVSIYITAAHLPQSLDCFEAKKIELSEEKEAESDKKEKKSNVKGGDEFFAYLNPPNLFIFTDGRYSDNLMTFNKSFFLDQDTPPPQPAS